MGIPSEDRIEYAVSSIGIESYPQNVIAKNTLWTLQLGYGRFFLKEYEGYFCVINTIPIKKYLLTKALKSDLTFDNNTFWVWYVDLDNNLSLQEWEPFVDRLPVQINVRTNIFSNVIGISVFLKENDITRVLVLNDNLELKMLLFNNIKSPSSPIIVDLYWESTRLPDFSNFINSDNTNLDIGYLNTSSPPNVYLETYYLTVPQNFTVTQIGNTNQILLNWDSVIDANFYIIERDVTPLFNITPISFISYTNSYTDIVTEVGNYYYRVKAFNQSLYIQSEWSEVKEIVLILDANFEAYPLVASVGTPIAFTDLSIPIGTITLWRWDFGDGSPYSYDQNPVHSYNSPGVYTVTLYVESGSFFDIETKVDYITIATSLTADFEATPTSGDANLMVQFTDKSEGDPVYWEWDFGDGTYSYEQNPVHVYTKAGVYTVKLTVKDESFTSTKTKIDYITVNMLADFTANITTGPADLVVFFKDLSLGEPTSWYWDFGDGFYSYERDPIHTYTEAGIYTVSLTVSNDSDLDSETKINYITVYAVADFYGNPISGNSTLLVNFTDASTGTPLSWYWDFGDGEYSTEQNPVHFYKKPGEYTVTLSITTSFNNNTRTKVRYIKVSGIYTPDIAPEPDIKAYLRGTAVSYDLEKGVEIKYLNKEEKI